MDLCEFSSEDSSEYLNCYKAGIADAFSVRPSRYWLI